MSAVSLSRAINIFELEEIMVVLTTLALGGLAALGGIDKSQSQSQSQTPRSLRAYSRPAPPSGRDQLPLPRRLEFHRQYLRQSPANPQLRWTHCRSW